MRNPPVACPALLCCAALVACATTDVANAPPEVMEDCRREVALISEVEPELTRPEQLPAGEAGPGEEVLDDARAAREEAEQQGLASWPEEVLLYRCLASRGVQLSDEQARTLAEWEGDSGSDGPE